MLSFSGSTFLFCFVFRLFDFTEAAALSSMVFRSSICMRPDSHRRSYLTTVCWVFFFSFLFLPAVFVSLEMSLFPSIYIPIIPFVIAQEF